MQTVKTKHVRNTWPLQQTQPMFCRTVSSSLVASAAIFGSNPDRTGASPEYRLGYRSERPHGQHVAVKCSNSFWRTNKIRSSFSGSGYRFVPLDTVCKFSFSVQLRQTNIMPVSNVLSLQSTPIEPNIAPPPAPNSGPAKADARLSKAFLGFLCGARVYGWRYW